MNNTHDDTAYPGWICHNCGVHLQRGPVDTLVSTCNTSKPCGWCGRVGISVTDPRHYGYPHFRKSKAGKYKFD